MVNKSTEIGVGMMETKFDLLVDSCCDLRYDELEDEGIRKVSMIVQMNDKEYLDDFQKTFKLNWFMEQIKEGATPTTSQINIGTYLDVFKDYINSEKPLLYVAFTSGLSGSYNNALSALKMIEDEHGKQPITIVDSKAACLGEGLLVEHVISLRREKKSLDEVLGWLDEMSPRLNSWVTVDDLDYLERGGRISKRSAVIGGMIRIKPIICMNLAGQLINVGKVRGRNKSISRLVALTQETIENPEEQKLIVAHAGDEVAGQKLRDELLNVLPVKGVDVRPMGPTIASHTGDGALAVFSFGRKRQAN